MDVRHLTSAIISRYDRSSRNSALLVGISGIDSSGKGYVSRRVAAELRSAGYMAALINADGWLNLPSVRFSDERQAAGQHFYEFGLRLDEMFERLIKPLVYSRSIDLTTDHTEETATKFRKHRYRYSNVDIVLLEGIFLFKRAFADYFDLKIWLECSFETALERAVLRGQERLSPTETTTAYREIYFPAQEHHFKSDDPVRSADLVFVND